MVVCPPFTALECGLQGHPRLQHPAGRAEHERAQRRGAFTGEIAAEMLKEFSVRYVILGHSERRQYQKESDALIARKAAVPLTPRHSSRSCASGETLAEREAGSDREGGRKRRCAAAWRA